MRDIDTLDVFLADAAEDPEDNTLRLILADWLADSGQPGAETRAELIRVQVELRRSDESQQPKLRARERALLLQHGDIWKAGPPPGVGVWFERGLLQTTMSAHLLTQTAVQTWWQRQAGWIIGLRLYDASDQIIAEIRDWLVDVPQIDLCHTPITDATALRLSTLGQLRALHLGHTSIADEGIRALSRLAGLRVLHLHGTGVSDEGVPSLARLSRLRRLSLRDTLVSDEGVRHLQGLFPGVTISR
jgi:uncharacterized protein (TIGR02996 family)